ncbi:MAG: diguanylate cyclase [Rubrimonas sp.]|uniref:GGDEF domain-containing protein n=1 Tax=Rubrimonas sp. TaxID=2036015 RepID=UPI002FDE52B2
MHAALNRAAAGRAEDDADLPVGVVRARADGAIVTVNAQARALLGLGDGGETHATGSLFGWLGGDGAALRLIAQRLRAPGETARRRLTGPQGRPLAVTLARRRDGGLVALLEDDAATAALERQAHEARARYAALADWTPRAAVWTVDLAGRIDSWSQSATRFEGLAACDAVGMTLGELFARAQFDADPDALIAQALVEGAAEAEGWRRAWGEGHAFVRATLRLVRDAGGAPSGFVAVSRAAAEASAESEELRRLAATDPLTGVLNRRAFFERLESGRRMALARGAGPAAILCDLDAFKQLNDAHGHAAGDAALRALAGAAQSMLRAGDLIGRIGGDEFAFALPGADAERAAAVAERLRRAVETLHLSDGPLASRGLAFTASFGVAAPDGPEEAFPQTLARADAALYRAKRAGRNCVASA